MTKHLKPEATDHEMEYLVVAGSYNQFRNWCDRNSLSIHSPRVKYVGNADKLRGYHNVRNVQLIKYGTWYERQDLQDAITVFEQFNPSAITPSQNAK